MTAVFIDGVGVWDAVARPAPALLPANTRRRASDAVLLALQVAGRALAVSGHDAASIASVFASANGDLATTDALCRTLAQDPLLLSPTRFHHSVHNAASGYWAIASGNRAPSTALAAGDHSVGAGWLEACSQCAADGGPVLLVVSDTAACGPLRSVNRSRSPLALAFVLAAQCGPASRWRVDWSLQGGPPAPAVMPGNPTGQGLPLCAALATGQPAQLALALGSALQLGLSLQPLQSAASSALWYADAVRNEVPRHEQQPDA